MRSKPPSVDTALPRNVVLSAPAPLSVPPPAPRPAPDRESLLQEINSVIPAGVDWKRGAKTYVDNSFARQGRENVEYYSMNKPLGLVGGPDPGAAITEITHYLYVFANALAILRAPAGTRVLDVACGGGWVSHYLSKLGYWTFGIDISSDFVDLARRRLSSDELLRVSPQDAMQRFAVLDIECERLPEPLRGTFDVVWLESCLHHFVDPISALEHLVEGLRPDGVIVLVEFENRQGPVKQEYMDVMREFDTLERPYSRSELERVFELVGLKAYEFLGAVNGWYSPRDPESIRMGEHLVNSAAQMNLAVCSLSDATIDRLFAFRRRRAAVSFEYGIHPNEGGFRWCGPSSDIVVHDTAEPLVLEVQSSLPHQTGQEQLIVARGPRGEIGRVSLKPKAASAQLVLDAVSNGDRITLQSSQAFSPAWSGGNDPRLLSFYIKTDA